MENLTHLNIHFNAGLPDGQSYEVHAPEYQRKGALIQDINTIQVSLGKGPVDMKQFEYLMQCTLENLTKFVNDQSSLLSEVKSNHSF